MSSNRNWPRKRSDLGILVTPARDPLYGYSREEVIAGIAGMLQNRVSEAWIFGSFASGSMHAYSDLDLILVTETGKPFPDRAEDFWDLLDFIPGMDILVYTKEEFKKIIENPSTGFWSSVTRGMMRVV